MHAESLSAMTAEQEANKRQGFEATYDERCGSEG